MLPQEFFSGPPIHHMWKLKSPNLPSTKYSLLNLLQPIISKANFCEINDNVGFDTFYRPQQKATGSAILWKIFDFKDFQTLIELGEYNCSASISGKSIILSEKRNEVISFGQDEPKMVTNIQVL